MYANIIIDITHEKLDKIFQYAVPSRLEGALDAGCEVEVPFGKGNRLTKGYVIGFAEQCDYDPAKIKEIRDISQKGIAIEGKLVALAAWMKDHYGGTMIQALKMVLPIRQQEKEKVKKKLRLLLDETEGREKLEYYLRPAPARCPPYLRGPFPAGGGGGRDRPQCLPPAPVYLSWTPAAVGNGTVPEADSGGIPIRHKGYGRHHG